MVYAQIGTRYRVIGTEITITSFLQHNCQGLPYKEFEPKCMQHMEQACNNAFMIASTTY